MLDAQHAGATAVVIANNAAGLLTPGRADPAVATATLLRDIGWSPP